MGASGILRRRGVELDAYPGENTERYANNRVEADHGQLKRRLRPMRGLKTDRGAGTVITGHAFIQNIRRGFYELAVDEPAQLRVAAAFTELTHAV